MRTRLKPFILFTVGGVLAVAATVGVTQHVGAAPAAGATSDTVPRFRGEAPTSGELWQPTGDSDEVPRLDELWDEAPTLDELQLPTKNMPLTSVARENARKTIGQLSVKFPDNTKKVGTATIVESDSGDMVITAQHLLVNGKHSASEVRFLSWTARLTHWYGREWATVPGSDVAMVLLYPRDTVHVQDMFGSQGICFDCEQKTFVHVYGYPNGFVEGGPLDTHCQVNADFSAGPDYPYGSCLEGNPALGDGAGGSPALANFDTNTGHGVVTAIHTSVFPDATGRAAAQGAAFLSKEAQAVYRKLQGKPADPVDIDIWLVNDGAFIARTTVLLPDDREVCSMPHLWPGTARITCAIPGGGAFKVRGLAIGGTSKDISVPPVPSPARACFAYHGTTFIGFDFVREEC